jgi:multidrug resistance protein, MATE family
MQVTMSTSTHARETLALGLPLAGSSLAQIALHVTDVVMIGWYGVIPLAAVVLGASSFFILFVLGSGFAKAVLPMVATALAREDETQVRRDTRMGLWLSIGYGVLVLPIFWWSEPILLQLGQQPEVAAVAADYLRLVGFGLVPALCVAVLQSYLSALGRTQIVLWVTLIAVLLNIAVNWALIFGNWGFPELGALGAAVATIATQVMSLVILAAYAGLLQDLRRFRLFQRFWRPDWGSLRQVWRLGVPIGLTGLAEGGMFHASALMMGWIGAVELAAHGIALEIAALTFMLHVGLSSAATIRVARFDGLGDQAALRRASRVAVAMSLGVALASVVLFLVAPRPIVALFLDMEKPDSVAILAYGVVLLAVAALFQLADGMQVMALGLLRGLQDTRVPMVLATISYWLIGIPVSYCLAFPLGLGGVGLWFGLVVGLVCASASLMWRFWRLVS